MAQNYINTMTILNAVKTAVDALRLPSDNSKALFDLVKLFDAPDVDEAFNEVLLARQKRLCFIVPGADNYENVRAGEQLQVQRRSGFALLICDTDRKTGQQAVFGGPANLGVIAMKDLVVDALTGAQLGLQYVALEPGAGDDFTVFREDQDDSGRKGWFQQFETLAGRKNVTLKRLSAS